jgi:hypothetical protein
VTGKCTSRQIVGQRSVPRDHAQLIAFQGELWMIAGRGGTPFIETPRVAIFDPASETWREGPGIMPRAGFAAAATESVIIIAGGEALSSTPFRVIPTVEAFVAGSSAWTPLPNVPRPVHGVPGAIHGNAFYMMGGSGQAGVATNVSEVQVYRW